MENYNKSLFEQILEIIRDVKFNKSNSSQELMKKFVELKRKFDILRQEQRSKLGQMTVPTMNKLLTELLELRNQGFENEKNINEILQIIAEEYKEQGDLEKTKAIHTDILGYEGTQCDNMDVGYIEEIIHRKMNKVRDTYETTGKDIINILLEAFQTAKLVTNWEQYSKLIEEAIIPLASRENDELLDKSIITVLNKLAKEYKSRGDYAKAFELCNKGKKLEQFKELDEYSELLKEHESLGLYLSLEEKFRIVKIDMKNKTLIEAIREALGKNEVIDVGKGRRRYIFKRNSCQRRGRRLNINII